MDHREFGADVDSDFHSRIIIRKVVAALAPVAACIDGSRYTLAAGPIPAVREIRQAVELATGCRVLDVAYVSQPKLEAGVITFGPLDFRRTLAYALESRHGFALTLGLDSRRWSKLRRQTGYEIPVPFADFLTDPMRVPRESLRAALFHFWGFAFARSERKVDELAPLVSLLARCIPFGELNAPGIWAVLVP